MSTYRCVDCDWTGRDHHDATRHESDNRHATVVGADPVPEPDQGGLFDMREVL